ncbi:signal-regulatory protein beta-2 isoform X1 [Oreochromis niloticus]|uniref:signal-regulatory protein beta-2 isoform X1 n=1 Tax=Oreochromis niloticus TaxID=8128 RepID=UPI000673F0A5|nr:signal-regulatory protein beta-2 isoform X1 [Oreochromis niloticus]
MIMVWITLIFLHRGYSLVPVKTVQLGEPVTLTCALPKGLQSGEVHWYKQNHGDTLKLIMTSFKSTPPEYGPAFSNSRFKVDKDNNFSNVTILKTVQEDEGIYHCGLTEWIRTNWSGTYLFVKGNTQRTSSYTVVQRPIISDPLRLGDFVTLECSVLSESDNKICSGELNVLWFKAGSHTSHPNIIYTDINKQNKCEKRSDTQKRCIYHFSKNVSSSDAGTYYCAVATCGEILFGNGTKLDSHGDYTWSQSARTVIFLLCALLAICLIVIAVLICTSKKNSGDNCEVAVLQETFSDQRRQQNKDTWMFSAAVFTLMKAERGALKDGKMSKRERLYMACKALGLD